MRIFSLILSFLLLAAVIFTGPGFSHADTITGTEGNDVLFGTAGDDTIYGLGGNDVIDPLGGNNIIDGGMGDDVLTLDRTNPAASSAFNNSFYSGPGTDRMEGFTGPDTYYYNRGDGPDVINDSGLSYNMTDRVIFGTGILVSHISLAMSGDDLLITVNDPANPAANDQILIENWFPDPDFRIESFRFEDGKTGGIAQIHAILLAGTNGDDVIIGWDDSLTISGLDGNDVIDAKNGDNTVDGGPGNDTITTGNGNDMVTGGAGIDTITDAGGNNQIAGAGGNDTIILDRSDPVAASAFTNIIVGGPGDDRIEASAGADTYMYNIADGRDTINDYDPVGATSDTLAFGARITSPFIAAMTSGNDMVIYGNVPNNPYPNDGIVIENWLLGPEYKIEIISFKDGSTLGITDIEALAGLAPPVISNVTVTNITGQSATITWDTDVPATSRVDYGKTIAYDQNVEDSALTTSHSIDLTGILSGTTYHFMVSSTKNGYTASTADNTFDTWVMFNITITTPAESETFTKPHTLVAGTVAFAGSEIGVTVNGRPALVSGNEFAANLVELAPGANTLIVRATDDEGNAAEAEVNVTGQAGFDYITMTPSAESGLSPMTVDLDITATFDLAGTSASANYSGPAAADSLVFNSVTSLTAQMSVPGIYTFNVEITDASSNTYTDSVAVLVLDPAAFDAFLKAKWNGMKTALAAQDVEGGVSYMLERSQDKYRDALNAIIVDLPQLFNNTENIEMIYARKNRIKYRINRLHDIEGTPVNITYYIYFIKNKDGIWKIEQF